MPLNIQYTITNDEDDEPKPLAGGTIVLDGSYNVRGLDRLAQAVNETLEEEFGQDSD